MLTACELVISRGQQTLLTQVDISVIPGEVVAVLGPNGSGKSTLINALCGEWEPAAGTITLNSHPLAQWPPRERAKQVAVLPQYSDLNFPFAVQEVVSLGRYPHATGYARDAEIVAETLAAADALHLAERNYLTLSGGEKQRVQLARVLAQVWDAAGGRDNGYLLLDEATSALDIAHQHSILQTARNMARQGVGVLLVLHDINLAAHYADRLVFLKQGEVIDSGTVKGLITEQNMQAVFGVEARIIEHPDTGKPLVIYCDTHPHTVSHQCEGVYRNEGNYA